MADTRSRGGKKHGTDKPEGQTEQHQTVDGRETRADQEPGGRPPAGDYPAQRPPTGEPGGPKPNSGQSRPQND